MHICNKIGHWAKFCRNKKFNVNELTSTKIEKTEFLGEVITSIKDNDWIKNFQIQIGNYNEIVKFKIDTGASVSVIPYSESLPKLEKCNTVLKGANMMNIKVKGCVECNITYKDRTIHEALYVLENQICGLLSRRASVALGVVRLIGEITEINPQIFEGLGNLERKYRIEMKDGVKPYAINVPRPIPIHQQQQVKEELEKMKDLGVIQEAIGPTEWCSPMVIAMKGNGKIRIFTDMTKLNLADKREMHPMAIVERSLSRIKGTIFSKLDANSGFWQIPLDEESWEVTNFLTPWGRYFYKKLPFGMKSAPEIVCKEITKIIGDCKGIIVQCTCSTCR